jgi:hypothetical protein
LFQGIFPFSVDPATNDQNRTGGIENLLLGNADDLIFVVAFWNASRFV